MTSVGGTSGVPETAASFSSGGFSNIFPMPEYQENAVEAYLAQLGNANAGKFKPSGRAYPDVSAISDNIEIVFQQQSEIVSGTSISSPVFASIIALINDRRISSDQHVLGFLNPFLYSTAVAQGAFTDIKTGSNPGCSTNGFPALPGWDPVSIIFVTGARRYMSSYHRPQVTGLGTPKFAMLAAAAGVTL